MSYIIKDLDWCYPYYTGEIWSPDQKEAKRYATREVAEVALADCKEDYGEAGRYRIVKLVENPMRLYKEYVIKRGDDYFECYGAGRRYWCETQKNAQRYPTYEEAAATLSRMPTALGARVVRVLGPVYDPNVKVATLADLDKAIKEFTKNIGDWLYSSSPMLQMLK